MSHLKVLSAGIITQSKFHIEVPQLLGATVRRLGFVHPRPTNLQCGVVQWGRREEGNCHGYSKQ